MERAFMALLVICALQSPGFAANGFSVSVTARTGANAPEYNYGANSGYWGPIVRFDFQANKVTGQQTIYSGMAQYPSINVEGTKVAFYRHNASMQNGKLVGSIQDSGWISVMNIDGSGLTNLVRVDKSYKPNNSDAAIPVNDWPAGDWIYYERPNKTAEIWRVNVNDPSLNEFVVRYGGAKSRRRAGVWSSPAKPA